jgi:hypothetical protein
VTDPPAPLKPPLDEPSEFDEPPELDRPPDDGESPESPPIVDAALAPPPDDGALSLPASLDGDRDEEKSPPPHATARTLKNTATRFICREPFLAGRRQSSEKSRIPD